MKPKNKIIHLTLGTLLGFLLAACSHGPTVQDFPETASAVEETNKLAQEIKDAEQNQMAILAPINFKAAKNSLEDAQESINKQKGSKKTLNYVATGKAYLDRASKFAKVSDETLGEVMAARKMAIDANAPTSFAKEFDRLDAQLKAATREIEQNDTSDAIKERSQMQISYLDLELRAIKHTQLNRAQEVIEQAVKEGAKEYAPRTLAVARKNWDDTSAYITSNRHDVSEVNARGATALASANHLLKITREAKVSDKASPEDLALRLEKDKMTVASQQGLIERGAAANEVLLSEQEMNRRFELAQSQFTKDEAEVYKQGSTMVIRLRGLEFPTAKASIKESNFPLLAKVRDVIEEIGPGTVIVEGHTDSVGGKAVNDKISAERASAVKAYLISNSKSDDLEIQAVGYGFQKPLGTNKTQQGRAQNRRVDILIKPVAAQSM